MGVEPSSCVVVEDSRYGVAAALAAGMRSVGFSGGLTKASDLADADVVIDDMRALPAAVAELAQS
jgi:beta-phosphoglucomutase-like phosphatase (HAD superfamily)